MTSSLTYILWQPSHGRPLLSLLQGAQGFREEKEVSVGSCFLFFPAGKVLLAAEGGYFLSELLRTDSVIRLCLLFSAMGAHWGTLGDTQMKQIFKWKTGPDYSIEPVVRTKARRQANPPHLSTPRAMGAGVKHTQGPVSSLYSTLPPRSPSYTRCPPTHS